MRQLRVIRAAHDIRDWLLQFERNDGSVGNDRRPLLLFLGCIVLYCVYMLLMQSPWVLGGGMWAESATNYFHFANAPTLAERFFSTDAGYIPLPQRLIAITGTWLQLPAKAIPYYYTWTGIVLTGALAGAFCLAPFRKLARSDGLRFFAAIAVLLIVDFETRTFINFTYFVAFFVSIVTALAFVDRQAEVPRWAWLIPLLMMSKPAVLSALPAMVLVSFVSRTRFRLITAAALLLCLAQLGMMYSTPLKVISGASMFSTAQKAEATLRYFLGFLGQLVAGRSLVLSQPWATALGSLLLVASLSVVLKKRNNAAVLIVIGLSLLFFNIAVHCFAMSANWNIDMQRLADFVIERHIVVGFSGVVLLMTGLAASLPGGWRSWLPAAAFTSWFLLSGWLGFAGTLNQLPSSPKIGNSHWLEMAEAIDSGDDVCVPVDPLGIIFTRNCSLLNVSISWYLAALRTPLYTPPAAGNSQQLELPQQPHKWLRSVAILARPLTTTSEPLQARIELALTHGGRKLLTGSRAMTASGGLLMLTGHDVTRLEDLESAVLHFSQPAELGHVEADGTAVPIVLWMGH
jgi:hypothetical protein